MRRFLIAVPMLLASQVSAQYIYPRVDVSWYGRQSLSCGSDGEPFSCTETAIAVSRSNPNEIIAAAMKYTVGCGLSVFYAISMDGGATFTSDGLFPASCMDPLFGADPMVAASSVTGSLWVGALSRTASPDGFFVARKALGSSTIGPVTNTLCQTHDTDKGLMAAGPRGASEELWIAFQDSSQSCSGPSGPVVPVMAQYGTSLYSSPSWTTPQWVRPPMPVPCEFEGVGVQPLILPSGINAGRILLAWAGPDDVPMLSSSNDGMIWAPAITLPQSPNWVNVEYGDVAGDFPVVDWPAMAFHPGNPDNVYVIFPAKDSTDPLADNVDLYIAHSADGGASFAPGSVVRITDAALGDTAGTDQFMPWIAVDSYGGLNLLYYRCTQPVSTPSSQVEIQPMYARLQSFPSTTAYVAALAPSFLVDNVLYLGGQRIGDYHMIDAVGCLVYPCYMSAHTGHARVYVNKITVCPADVDTDGFVTHGDVLAFGSAYISGATPADVNRDGAVTIQDVADFNTAYTCGCGTP